MYWAQQEATRSTRHSSENNSSGSKLTPAQVLYNDIIDTMKVIDTQVGEADAISGSKSNKFSFLKKLPSMLGRTFPSAIKCLVEMTHRHR